MVLIACYLLLLFYVFLMIVRFFPAGPLTYWGPFSKVQNLSLDTNFGDCQTDDDCSTAEKCMSLGQPSKQCVPKYRSDQQCNEHTGSWTLSQTVNGLYYVKCVCKYPDLVTQKHEGSDCNVDVACGEHGHLETLQVDPFQKGKCLCEEGYRSDRTASGPFCRRVLAADVHYDACDPPHFLTRSDAERVYHPDYLAQFKNDTCFRNPCSINPLTDEPLQHTELWPGKGCVCDPHWGNVGIRFDADQYLKLPGYSACVNIFGKEPDAEIDVALYTHYFIRREDPKTFVHFTDLDKDDVDPTFRDLVQHGTLQVEEIWPHNYVQYVLKNKYYDIRTRRCSENAVFGVSRCEERVMRSKTQVNCRDVSKFSWNQNKQRFHSRVYELLYRNPVCHWTDPGRYEDTFLVNPHLMSFNNHMRELFRSNAIVLRKVNGGSWSVDMADSKYHGVLEHSRFPDLTDKYVVRIVFDMKKGLAGSKHPVNMKNIYDDIYPITIDRFRPDAHLYGDDN